MPKTALKRRNAQRAANVVFVHLGHEFQRNYFTQPTNCTVCDKFLWGVRKKQGFQCRFCMMACHCECVEKVMVKCMKSRQSRQQAEQQNKQIQINIPHKWKVKQFLWRPCAPETADQGTLQTGTQCESCKIFAKKCKDLIVPDYLFS